jgi:origin recognition complex subunit 5
LQPVTPRRTTKSSDGSAYDPASPTFLSKSRPKSMPRRQVIPAAAKEEGKDEQSTINVLLESFPCRNV